MGFNDNDFFVEETSNETQPIDQSFSNEGNNSNSNPENSGIIYEEEGFKGYVRKYRRSKWFIPTIVLLVILLIIAIIFSVWTNSTGTLEAIELKEISKIYLDETVKVKASAKGSGNLSKTIFHYEISPTNVAFLDSLGGLKGKTTTNSIHPIITGKAILTVKAEIKGSKLQSNQQEIAICKRLSNPTDKIEISIGSQKQLPIDVGTENICYTSLDYKIKDTSIATLNELNQIVGKKAGTTEIVITDNDKKISIPIIVNEDLKPITKLSFNKKSEEIIVGKAITLTPNVSPKDTKENIYWKSSNEAVATVENGKVTAISKGTTTITVSNNDNSISASIKINVKPEKTPNNSGTSSTPTHTPTSKPSAITYTVTMKSNNQNRGYATKGNTITVSMDFSKKLSSTPKVTIAGVEATVKGSEKSYQASIKINSSIRDGKASLKITYKDNNTTKTISSVTKGNAVVIDKTNPKCRLSYQNNILTIVGNDTNGISGYLINQSSTSTGKYGTTKKYIPSENGTYYGHVIDKAGNYGICSYQITSIRDITTPTIKSVTMKSSNTNRSIAKVGDTITVTLEFSEELGVAPSVGIAGHSAIISKIGSKTYRATVKVDSSYKSGYVYLSISDYKDLAGNIGIGRTTVTDNSVVTIIK